MELNALPRSPNAVGSERTASSVLRNEAMTEMANIPQQTKNATDEALAAVEDALNIRPASTRVEPRLTSEPPLEAGQDTPAPATTDLFRDETAREWPAGDSAPRLPANDDRASMGEILQTLRRRRARAPYVVAAVAAAAWIAGAAALVFLFSAELQALIATPRVGFAVRA